LLRFSVDGTLRRHADLLVQSPHGPNDIVIDGRGNTYVNNVNFDFAAGPPAGDPAPGFVALVKDGCARVVADDLGFPTGWPLPRHNATLIVAESYRHRLTAFDIGADGSLSNRRVWADVGDHSPASARALRCWIGSNSIAARSPARSAGTIAPPCSWSPRTGPARRI
jgi:sugar lactone lactonase YvrE